MRTLIRILTIPILLAALAGCSKDSFDPASKTRSDFMGTWKGTISTFKDNKLMKESGSVYIYPVKGGSAAAGILFMSETQVLEEFQFVDGTLYFKVKNNDPESPFCQKWSLGGYAVFTSEKEIELHITGNECGQVGNEYVNWVGTLGTATVPADSVLYFNFAAASRSWTYHSTLLDGDTCRVVKQISASPAEFSFTGATTDTCGWSGTGYNLKWTVTPAAFTIQLDSNLCEKQVNLAIDAKMGVIYRSILSGTDTVTVKLADTSTFVTTPAGTFQCDLYQYTEPVTVGSTRYTRYSRIWLNNLHGIIRHEVQNQASTTGVTMQVLTGKNF